MFIKSKSFRLVIGLLLILLSTGIAVFKSNNNHINKIPSTSDCIANLACKNCNLILISVDSLRADHVGAFGYQRNTTPFFDKLSKEGILFKNHFSTSYLTPITEMSVHTGMYPISNQMTNFNTIMPTDNLTLAQILQNQGYKTIALHNSPEFVTHDGVKTSFNRGFEVYQNLGVRILDQYNNQKLIKTIQNLPQSNSFLWLTLGGIHWPYQLENQNFFIDPNYNGYLKDRQLNWRSTFMYVYDNQIYPNKISLTPSDNQYIIDAYDNGIRNFDILLEQIFETLKNSNLSKNTIVIISSEHGEDLGEHKYFAHYDIHDTQTHVPLLIIAPPVRESQQITSITSGVDVFSTILQLLGFTSPNQSQGKSLLPLICKDYGAIQQSNSAIIIKVPLWEQVSEQQNIQKVGLDPKEVVYDISIRTPDWQYILRLSKEYHQKFHWWSLLTKSRIDIPQEELYYLPDDPEQIKNVVDKYPDEAGKLKQQLLDWYKNTNTHSGENIKVTQMQEYF